MTIGIPVSWIGAFFPAIATLISVGLIVGGVCLMYRGWKTNHVYDEFGFWDEQMLIGGFVVFWGFFFSGICLTEFGVIAFT